MVQYEYPTKSPGFNASITKPGNVQYTLRYLLQFHRYIIKGASKNGDILYASKEPSHREPQCI